MKKFVPELVINGIYFLSFQKGSAFVDQSGKLWRAQDIGFQDRTCKWMPHGFMSINATSDAGKAFLKSLYKDYIDWGVDFSKLRTNSNLSCLVYTYSDFLA